MGRPTMTRANTVTRSSAVRRVVVGLALLALGSTAAWAFPWDIDMVDSLAFKAFEWRMKPLPVGTVSIGRFRGGFDKTTRMTPVGDALANPLAADAQVPTPTGPIAATKKGEHLFGIYCRACHGENGQGNAPVMDMTNGKRRYPIPAAILSGTNAVTPLRSDGYIFLTVQQGGAIMPSYAYALSDADIWSIVAYVRTLPGAQYNGGTQKAPVTP
jgi:S-disulfanyl-L-cysteine oxidoreductase SoxD